MLAIATETLACDWQCIYLLCGFSEEKAPINWNNVKPRQQDVCHIVKVLVVECSHFVPKDTDLKGTLEICHSLLFEVLFEPQWKK